MRAKDGSVTSSKIRLTDPHDIGLDPRRTPGMFAIR